MESLDFYGCTQQACRLKEGSVFTQHVLVDKTDRVSFCGAPQSENRVMLLSLQFSAATDGPLPEDSGRLWNMEIPDLLYCDEESMQNRLLPLLSYMFLGLFMIYQGKCDFPQIDNREWPKLGRAAGIVGIGTNYKQVFNSLFFAMCSFYFFTYKRFGEDVIYVNENRKFPKILAQAQEKILLLLEPAGALHLMKFLASILPLNGERALTISYSFSFGNFWSIACYSQAVSLKNKRKSRLWKLGSSSKIHKTSKLHLLNCILQFEYVVTVYTYHIEVCLQMDNVRCDVLPLNFKYLNGRISIADHERHFPTKIYLRIDPGNGHGAKTVSLSEPSANPVRNIGRENTYGVTFQPPVKAGVSGSVKTSSTSEVKNWGLEQSTLGATSATMCWTLYDTKTRDPVCEMKHSKFPLWRHKTPSIYRCSKAGRAFTEQGGVIFVKNNDGNPITWRINSNKKGQTLQLNFEASIWLTNKPNTPYSATERHDFRQVVDLLLETTPTPN